MALLRCVSHSMISGVVFLPNLVLIPVIIGNLSISYHTISRVVHWLPSALDLPVHFSKIFLRKGRYSIIEGRRPRYHFDNLPFWQIGDRFSNFFALAQI